MLPLVYSERQPHPGDPVAAWPLFGLRLVAADLELRPAREADGAALAALLPGDVELDPAASLPGLLEGRPARAAITLQGVWRCWADWTPQRWALPFAVRLAGQLVGTQVLEGTEFATLRTVDSASWLLPAVRGRGLGRRMRAAVLTFAFRDLGAEWAVTSAWSDNAASLGVSRSLGYRPNGVERHLRPGVPGGAGDMVHLRLARSDWEARPADDVRVVGLGACRSWFWGAAEPQA